jgi:hypothetical protein
MMIEDYGHAIEATVSLRVVSCNEPRDVALYLVPTLLAILTKRLLGGSNHETVDHYTLL